MATNSKRAAKATAKSATAKTIGKPSRERMETLLIHAGQEPDRETGAVVVPLHTATTFAQSDVGVTKGFDYSRGGNPTRRAFETAMAKLENGERGFGFASGMAAISTVAQLLSKGDHIVAEQSLYGGTVRYFNHVLKRFGVDVSYVDGSDPENVEQACRPNTKMVYVETPTNPTMKLVDLAQAAAIAEEHGALCAVDNTFASPYLQRPLELGCHVSIHSATKYIGGHSDVLAGVAVVDDAELGERLHFLQKSIGGVSSPWDCWLLLRGLKTLHVRMERHNANAQAVAEFLEDHPKVTAVHYPGLASHPQHELAKRQMRLFGGMMSFEVRGFESARKVMQRVKVWTLAESLGAVESLISHPASMTHASVAKEQREKAGVTEGLVRLSVGLENVDDLTEDLAQALRSA